MVSPFSGSGSLANRLSTLRRDWTMRIMSLIHWVCVAVSANVVPVKSRPMICRYTSNAVSSPRSNACRNSPELRYCPPRRAGLPPLAVRSAARRRWDSSMSFIRSRIWVISSDAMVSLLSLVGLVVWSMSRCAVSLAASYAGQLTRLVSSSRTLRRCVMPALSRSDRIGMNPTLRLSRAPSFSRATASRPSCVSAMRAVMCSPSSRLSAPVMRPMSWSCW